MKEEVLDLSGNIRKTIHYPSYRISSEHPHRLYPFFDISIQAFHCILIVFFLEAIMLASVHFGGTPELGMFLAAIIPFSVFCSGIFLRNTRLTISESGISFPVLMAPALNGRLFRPWSDLLSVDLHETRDSLNYVNGNSLTFTFKSGGCVDIGTTRIPRADLRLLQQSLIDKTDLSADLPALTDLVARNDLEIFDSQLFVFLKKHRQVLSDSFGVTNHNLYAAGKPILNNEYIVERVLAGSAGRSAYLVADVANGRNVCMREYDLRMLDGDARLSAAQELQSTGELYKDLQIPYLLNLLDVRLENDNFYVFMEPQSKSLREYLKKSGTLDEKAVLSLALKLAEAVDRLQNLNPLLTIGGIRPDSIAYSPDGSISIGEFGFADDILMKFSNQLLVDAPYAAPERISSRPGNRSDLYSIGATMYFALTGIDPIPFATSQVRSSKPKVSQTAALLIEELLNPDPTLRGTVQELIMKLGGFVSVTEAVSGGGHE